MLKAHIEIDFYISLFGIKRFMKNIQFVDFEAIERDIFNWNQSHSKSLCNDLSLITIEVQKRFQQWIGLDASEFFQYITPEKIMDILGLFKSGLFTSLKANVLHNNIHDTCFRIKSNSKSGYFIQGNPTELSFEFLESPFGRMLIASTSEGICSLSFEHSENIALGKLKLQFPKAQFIKQTNEWHNDVQQFISLNQPPASIIPLHIYGTPFQIEVWTHLLKIPFGSLKTYGMISDELNHPMASRAVGKAVGANPIAYIIPCHRIVPARGIIGHYMWGKEKKQAIIGWEMYHSQNLSIKV